MGARGENGVRQRYRGRRGPGEVPCESDSRAPDPEMFVTGLPKSAERAAAVGAELRRWESLRQRVFIA